MRTLTDERGLTEAFGTAGREAERAFGSSTLYVEKALQAPRHVEIQLLGDRHGNVVHLFERDCSIQRRHQKIIEETPCPALPAETLERMANVALTLAHAVSYDSVGTIEFLLDKGGAFYFLEMNTRLQVEHPISELITGFDLVSEMVRVAEGQPLGYEQATVTRRGAAIECRIYAEDPASGFLPRTGTLVAYREPSGPFVRVDSGVAEGSLIGSHYDPLLAKICTWGANRTEAIARMRRALQETRITGVTTNLELLRAILDEPGFRAGDYDTHTLTRHPELCSRRASPQLTAALASAAHASRTREEQRFRANPITGWASHGRTRRG
jgi:acetyl-CoA carboxylase biotin carboxylase subunit